MRDVGGSVGRVFLLLHSLSPLHCLSLPRCERSSLPSRSASTIASSPALTTAHTSASLGLASHSLVQNPCLTPLWAQGNIQATWCSEPSALPCSTIPTLLLSSLSNSPLLLDYISPYLQLALLHCSFCIKYLFLQFLHHQVLPVLRGLM